MWSSQVVNRKVEKALDFLLMKVHSDDMSEPCNTRNITSRFVNDYGFRLNCSTFKEQTHKLKLVSNRLRNWTLNCNKNLALTSFSKHRSKQFADNRSSLPHLALFAVGKVWNDSDDILGTRGLQSVSHDQQLHNGCVNISEKQYRAFIEDTSCKKNTEVCVFIFYKS